MTEQVGQIAPRDRIAVLDVLRGLAILLILLMNIPDMGNLGIVRADVTGWTTADQVATWIQRVVFAGTQRGMLELLFGAGMLIMAARAMKPDGPVAVADAYYRRNLWLALFGLAHALLFMWWGEILFPYGIAALLIFQFRTLAPRTLLVIGLTVLLVSGYWQGKHQYDARAKLMHDAPIALALKAEGKPLSDEQTTTLKRWDGLQGFAHGTGEDVQAERIGRTTGLVAFFTWNLEEWTYFTKDWLVIVILEAASTMLIGAALFKWGIIHGKRTARFYLLMIRAGAAVADLRYQPDHVVDARSKARLDLLPVRPAGHDARPPGDDQPRGHHALRPHPAASVRGRGPHSAQRLFRPVDDLPVDPVLVFRAPPVGPVWNGWDDGHRFRRHRGSGGDC